MLRALVLLAALAALAAAAPPATAHGTVTDCAAEHALGVAAYSFAYSGAAVAVGSFGAGNAAAGVLGTAATQDPNHSTGAAWMLLTQTVPDLQAATVWYAHALEVLHQHTANCAMALGPV